MSTSVLVSDYIAIHPKIVEALSQHSGLFGALWPVIVEQASFNLRYFTLRKVNHYFRDLCHNSRRSDRAKFTYFGYFGNSKTLPTLPFKLDLSVDYLEWACWGADKCGFLSAENFREFCDLGDIDPDSGAEWNPVARHEDSDVHNFLWAHRTWMWISRSKDIVFETSINPLMSHEGYCHHIGLTGMAEKAIQMYDFIYQGGKSKQRKAEWVEMCWERRYI